MPSTGPSWSSGISWETRIRQYWQVIGLFRYFASTASSVLLPKERKLITFLISYQHRQPLSVPHTYVDSL